MREIVVSLGCMLTVLVHCWNYRRHVSSKANKSWNEEFNFTTKKIEDNFSNYSAWHQRSAILDVRFKQNEVEAVALLQKGWMFFMQSINCIRI